MLARYFKIYLQEEGPPSKLIGSPEADISAPADQNLSWAVGQKLASDLMLLCILLDWHKWRRPRLCRSLSDVSHTKQEHCQYTCPTIRSIMTASQVVAGSQNDCWHQRDCACCAKCQENLWSIENEDVDLQRYKRTQWLQQELSLATSVVHCKLQEMPEGRTCRISGVKTPAGAKFIHECPRRCRWPKYLPQSTVGKWLMWKPEWAVDGTCERTRLTCRALCTQQLGMPKLKVQSPNCSVQRVLWSKICILRTVVVVSNWQRWA